MSKVPVGKCAFRRAFFQVRSGVFYVPSQRGKTDHEHELLVQEAVKLCRIVVFVKFRNRSRSRKSVR